MRTDVAAWSARRTHHDPAWSADELVAALAGRRVSVVLPALDEQDTVAGVVEAVRPLLGTLVHELVVLDSGSTDATAARALAAGARVVSREEALPGVAPVPGKGEVLWRSLAATSGDVVVFLDADLVELDAGFVTALLGPLLTGPGVALVKGFYRRPLRGGGEADGTGGGRVTELVARPLLAALRPALSGVVQPLGGEYAATRDLLVGLPFAPGYGVEIGLLLDTEATRGLDAIAQVNLGVRKHRHRSLLDLGVMGRQILATTLARCGLADSGEPLTQFVLADGQHRPRTATAPQPDRPPMRSVGPSSPW